MSGKLTDDDLDRIGALTLFAGCLAVVILLELAIAGLALVVVLVRLA